MVLRTVGESVFPTTLRFDLLFSEVDKGGKAVWRDNFGLFGVGGRVEGITESMAPATCFRSSELSGDSDRLDLEDDKALGWRVGLGVGERMGITSMSSIASRL